jgi:hypothetical protein
MRVVGYLPECVVAGGRKKVVVVSLFFFLFYLSFLCEMADTGRKLWEKMVLCGRVGFIVCFRETVVFRAAHSAYVNSRLEE